MTVLRLILVNLFLAVGCLWANGQVSYRLIDTYVGLPDNEVKAMFKVPDGRLGICTSSSFSLFDGCEVRSFSPIGNINYPMRYVASLPTAYVDADQRVWLKSAGTLLVFDLRKERYVKDIASLLLSMGVRTHIKDVFVDTAKDVWLVSQQGKLLRLCASNSDTRNACHCELLPIRTQGLRDICRHGSLIWFVYQDGWVYGYDLDCKRRLFVQRLWKGTITARDFVRFAQSDKQVWVMWNHGIASFQPSTRQWKTIFVDDKHILVSMQPTPHGVLYVAVRQQGLVTLYPNGKPSTQNTFSILNGDDIEDDVETIVYDHGNLLLGMSASGICFYSPSMQRFPFIPFNNQIKVDMGGYRINDFRGQQALVSTRFNLYVFNPYNGVFTPLASPPFGTEFLRGLSDSQGRIWTGTFRDGMYRVDKGKVFHLMQGEIPAKDINFNIVRGFLEDRQHRIWLHFHGGIGWFDEKNMKIHPIQNPLLERYKVINDFAMDGRGNLWVASSTGLFCYSPRQNKVWLPKDFVEDDEACARLNGACKALLIDSRGLVWVGTLNGLYVINPNQKRVQRIGKQEGMPNEVVQGIIEDKNGHVWVTTSYGLCMFRDISEGHFVLTVFDNQNRLGNCRFGWMEVGHIANGKLLFGVKDGFYVVDPDKVQMMGYSGHPLFTALSVNNQEILPGKEYDGHVILESALSHTQKVVLRHNENFITVKFSGLNFDMPNHTYFKYRLKGSSDHWIEISPQDGVGKVSYTDLEPGTYELEVYSAGFDKRWNEHPVSLQIVVEAPIWATWWAKTLYLLLIIGILTYGVRKKMEQNRQRLEMEKNKELEEMKYRFFTNISHEFRTLLTLIITPIGSLLRRTTDTETRRQLNDVSRNAGDLLQLVNQLLDFRKMEMNGEQLCLTSGNFDEFVKYSAMKFQGLSEQKRVSLQVVDNSGGIFMYFDRDKVGKMLTNLLSNAFKFTDAGGSIKVCLSKEIVDSRSFARIEVRDTGCGISEEDQQHIFERFFRSSGQTATHVGSGIGLNMVAEYVKLHQGRIWVESQLGKGSCFVVLLPTDLREDPKTEDFEAAPANTASTDLTVDSTSNKYASKVVLVVEDNDEFRQFLVRELNHIYNKVLMAEDGLKGALIAEEQNPDIIVSDVMMPRMNGMDMCRRIKENIQTSHIPVVLLTAWSTSEGQTEGYKVGADAYIAKPFDMELLLVCINNLLEKQDKRIQDFTHSLSLDAKSVTDSTPDETFLNEIIACIEKNIDNTEYTIDTLARDVVMSRMSLYRKMKSLTGQTPADFIRTVRLKSAAKLLKSGKYNVSEVCYQTGFASPQNFAKHFKEMFGVLPSQYNDSVNS